jgi:hypothetical protein
MVDWEEGAQMDFDPFSAFNYNKAKENAKTVALKTGILIKSLGIDFKNVHCIGHSLG